MFANGQLLNKQTDSEVIAPVRCLEESERTALTPSNSGDCVGSGPLRIFLKLPSRADVTALGPWEGGGVMMV